MEQVVKSTVFMTDLGEFQAMNGIYAKHVPQPYPARSTIQVAGLPMGAKVEIEMIVWKGGNKFCPTARGIGSIRRPASSTDRTDDVDMIS